ncbi:methyltransferase domain-containing protein [Hydrogenovibrio kuenenii]|uniref:methyltransferase domain-containing protein n=1 Tax=Hydrogenovibrio kuenenii TaxID=63658 RepID=UPI0004666CF4|nr:methyltransferase domain-containing protein [Hydrogenovibrio kuenenii]
MKLCLKCGEKYESTLLKCPACNFEYKFIDGFEAYAEKFAEDGGGFEADSFDHLAQVEEDSFWFRSRNRILVWMLKKYCTNMSSYLEVGCGTGYVLRAIKEAFPNVKTYGSEIFIAGLKQAKNRLSDTTLFQMDARKIPYYEEFNVIGAFDVVEHIKEDKAVFQQMYQALKPGGFVILTVPQHPLLWSQMDVLACHERRYTRNELQEKLKQGGFKIVRTTSFVTFLLPMMMIRITKKNRKVEVGEELSLPPILDKILEMVMKVELFFIKAGVNFPVGGSRLVLAQKL